MSPAMSESSTRGIFGRVAPDAGLICVWAGPFWISTWADAADCAEKKKSRNDESADD
jgi:hypothetical protein